MKPLYLVDHPNFVSLAHLKVFVLSATKPIPIIFQGLIGNNISFVLTALHMHNR